MPLNSKMAKRIGETLQRRRATGSPLERDAIDMAHLLLAVGWFERRLFAQQLATHGLTVPQFFTLVAIHQHEEGCTMGVLAGETRQCSATMTGIVDRLLKTGFVERLRDDRDRRLVLVTLTEAGREVLWEAFETRLNRLRDALSRIDEVRRREIIDSLSAFMDESQAELAEDSVDLSC